MTRQVTVQADGGIEVAETCEPLVLEVTAGCGPDVLVGMGNASGTKDTTARPELDDLVPNPKLVGARQHVEALILPAVQVERWPRLQRHLGFDERVGPPGFRP